MSLQLYTSRSKIKTICDGHNTYKTSFRMDLGVFIELEKKTQFLYATFCYDDGVSSTTLPMQ